MTMKFEILWPDNEPDVSIRSPEWFRKNDTLVAVAYPIDSDVLVSLVAPFGCVFWSFGLYPRADLALSEYHFSRLKKLEALASEVWRSHGGWWSPAIASAVFNQFGVTTTKEIRNYPESVYWSSGRVISCFIPQSSSNGLLEHFELQLSELDNTAFIEWSDDAPLALMGVDKEPDCPALTAMACSVPKEIIRDWTSELDRYLSQSVLNSSELTRLLHRGAVSLFVSPGYEVESNVVEIENLILARAAFLAKFGPLQIVARELGLALEGSLYLRPSCTSKLRDIFCSALERFSFVEWTPTFGNRQ